MKKKKSTRENINLFFSAFLILAYIVCGYFFAQFAETLSGAAKPAVIAAILALFGLLVFYATRVGEGKAIKRFSLLTLLLVVVPALYIILASVFEVFPLHAQLEETKIVVYMAAIAFGYGIPYTFFSGFELKYDDDEEENNKPEVLEGGVEADLEEAEEPKEEEPVEEVVVEGVEAEAESEAETQETEPEEAETAKETE